MHQLLQRIFKKLLLLLFVFPHLVYAQQRLSLPDYIEKYRYIAMAEMRASGIPASIKLAQAILESGFGNSELAVKANNHFGIKCHGWTGDTYYYDDDAPMECFRNYSDPLESFLDHTTFLLTRPWYLFLFDLDPTDYRAWAQGLQDAGYATNPQYANLLIRLIEDHSLYRFDAKALDPSFLLADIESAGYQLAVRDTIAALPEREKLADEPRAVRYFNRIRYVTAREGDTPGSLARELDMRKGQIINYNDLGSDEELRPGQRVYLQPKRRKGPQEYHIARESDTMARISYEYGIRIENLYRRNDMTYGMEPEPGDRILLQGYVGSFFEYLFRRP